MNDETSISITIPNEERCGQVLVREIYKNGWLNIPTTEKKTRFNNKVNNVNHKVWVAFCVHDDIEAFLEYYDGQSSVLAHKPLESWHLGNCLHVSPNIALQDDEHLFSITLDTQILTFSASSRDEMMEWIDTMKNRLMDLGVLGPAHNPYTKEPELRPRLAPIRDPMSPLPPTPGLVALPPGTIWPIVEASNSAQVEVSHETPAAFESSEFDPFVQLRHRETDNSMERPHSARESTVTTPLPEFVSESLPTPAVPMSAPPSSNGTVFDFTPVGVALTIDAEDSFYEPLYLSRSLSTEAVEGDNENLGQQICDGARIEGSILSLKEKQVLQLRKEMAHEAGIRLRLRRKDCLNAIAFAHYMESAWVVGWKQKTHPLLYHNFHIGDKILSVEGEMVKSSQEIQKVVRQSYTPYVEFIVARIPFGKAIAIKREVDGQDLGLVREGNTAEILNVQSDGLAAIHGLTARSPTPCGNSLCNWMLTEINGRPLNLFYKGNEIQERLNAVGKDISILVQPADFVKVLKKQLKSIRSYKDYIVQ